MTIANYLSLLTGSKPTLEQMKTSERLCCEMGKALFGDSWDEILRAVGMNDGEMWTDLCGSISVTVKHMDFSPVSWVSCHRDGMLFDPSDELAASNEVACDGSYIAYHRFTGSRGDWHDDTPWKIHHNANGGVVWGINADGVGFTPDQVAEFFMIPRRKKVARICDAGTSVIAITRERQPSVIF